MGGSGEVRDEEVGGPIIDVGRRGHLQHLAVPHHADAVAEHNSLSLIVSHVHAQSRPSSFTIRRRSSRRRRRSLASRFDKGSSSSSSCGSVDKAPGKRDPLHLPARERHNRALRVVPRAQRARAPRRPCGQSRARGVAPVLQRIGDILAHRHMRPDRVRLEHHAEIAQTRRHEHAPRRRGDHAFRHRDLAGSRMLKPGDAAQGRGLAAPRRPEQDHDLAGGDAKAHVVHGRPARRRTP